MLINCKECGKVFSDKAACCPNCGCPNEIKELEQIKEEIALTKEELKGKLTKSVVVLLGLIVVSGGISLSTVQRIDIGAILLLTALAFYVYFLNDKNNYAYGIIGAAIWAFIYMLALVTVTSVILNLPITITYIIDFIFLMYPVYRLIIEPALILLQDDPE